MCKASMKHLLPGPKFHHGEMTRQLSLDTEYHVRASKVLKPYRIKFAEKSSFLFFAVIIYNGDNNNNKASSKNQQIIV